VNHFASPAFWACYEALPKRVQTLAAKNFRLLNSNPEHPSLRLKRVKEYWSVRVGIGHRALAIPVEDGLLWFWIGTHGDYDRLIRG
jgi:hypothetical protein